MDRRVVPNGRRDYFEAGPHLRNLENHIGAIAQEISSRCRQASSQRNKLRNVDAAIHRLKAAFELARSGYLRPADSDALIEGERERIPAIRQFLEQVRGGRPEAVLQTVAHYEGELGALDTGSAPTLNTVPSGSRAAVQSAFGTIVRSLPPDSALELIEAILKQMSEGHTVDEAGPDAPNPTLEN